MGYFGVTMCCLIHPVLAPYGLGRLFLPRARVRNYGNKAILPLPIGVPADGEGQAGLDPLAIDQGKSARLRGQARRREIADPLRRPDDVFRNPATGLRYQAVDGGCRLSLLQSCTAPA